MRRNRMSALLMSLALLLLALAPAASAQTSGPHRLFLPVVYTQVSGPLQPQVTFYAGRYSLPTGGCATLTWRAQGATAVYLDGASVPAQGSQQVCPFATQFYSLEAVFGGPLGNPPQAGEGSIVVFRELVLTAGDPPLKASEVIAQAVINAITESADVDPTTTGDQPGYRLDLKNVNALFTGSPGWNHAAVTLNVPAEAINIGQAGPVHWPLHAGQHVEFYAACDGDDCLLDYVAWHYLYMTSE